MLLDELYEAVVDLVPHFVGRNGTELAGGNRDREIELAFVADVNDHRVWTATTCQEMCNLFNRFLGCRKANAHQRTMCQGFQPLQRESQVGAALVVGYRMNLINDHGLNITQDRAALLRCKQDVQRLRCRDKNMRRTLQHRTALVHERVAGADSGANLWHQEATFACHLQNFAEREFEVLLDIVAQRLQWRNVQDLGAILEIARQRFSHQSINAGEKCGEGLAGASGRRNERGVTSQNVRPSLLLRLRGRAEAADKPIPHERVGPSER